VKILSKISIANISTKFVNLVIIANN